MARGRKPKPPGWDVIDGNAGRRRKDGREVEAEPLSAEEAERLAPEFLSSRATELFGQIAARVAAMQLLTKSDIEAVMLIALRIEEIEQCDEVMRTQGRTYETISTLGAIMYRARPEVAQRSDAMRHLQALLAEFGLTPAARSRVRLKDGPPAPGLNRYFS